MSRRGSGATRVASIAAGVMALALPCGAAHAAEDAAAPDWLAWRAPVGANECTDARGFADKVERRLGAAADAKGLGIDVEIRSGAAPAPRWHAEVRVRRPSGGEVGSRTIDDESPSCASVEDLAAFVVALVLSGGPAGTSIPVAPPAVMPPPDVSSRADAREGPVSPPPASRVRVAVAAGPVVGPGLMPGLTLGAEVSAYLGRWAGPQLSLGLAAWRGHWAQVVDGVGAHVSLVLVKVGLCPVSIRGAGRALRACAGGEAGWLSATGSGFDTSTEQDHAVVNVSAGARFEQAIAGPVFVAAEARAEVPLFRVRVAYAGPTGEAEEIFRMLPVAAVGQLQVGVSFGP